MFLRQKTLVKFNYFILNLVDQYEEEKYTISCF